MNDINKIVFNVYKNVLEMDYSKNDHMNFDDKIKKIYRYLVSGYVFYVKKNRSGLKKWNEFNPTNNIYSEKKFVIYTVSTGTYDKIEDPFYIDDTIDYFVFTDQKIDSTSIWKRIAIPDTLKDMSALEQARFLKTHPHLYFRDYDYSMFIDGNVRITCDIKPLFYSLIESKKIFAIHRHQNRDCIYTEAKAIYAVGKANKKTIKKQINYYKDKGFPKHFGLFETNIVIRKHNDKDCINIMNNWWDEMKKWTKRDQLSFTYSLWKNDYNCNDVLSLGNNSRRNPYFIVDSHK